MDNAAHLESLRKAQLIYGVGRRYVIARIGKRPHIYIGEIRKVVLNSAGIPRATLVVKHEWNREWMRPGEELEERDVNLIDLTPLSP